MSARTTITTAFIAGGLLAGCFIDELPQYDDDGSGVMGQTPAVRSLAVGSGGTCAVLATGGVRCWGYLPAGIRGAIAQLALRPVAMSELAHVDAMAMAPYHGCVLVAGAVSCYGSNDQGQVGNGQQGAGTDLPLQAAIGATDVAQLSLSSSRSSVRTTSGTVLAWGAAFIGFGANMPTPVAGLSAVSDLSTGSDHDCAVHSGGMVSCWGWSTYGQLGRGTVPPPNQQTIETPGPVVGVSDAMQVIAGYDNCVLHADGTVSCWGGGPFFDPPQPTPTLMAGLTGVQKLVAGGSHVCALMNTGTVACWGYSGMGALGIGANVVASVTPVTVPGLTGVVEVAAGEQSTCARRSDGEVFCWGGNIPGDGSKPDDSSTGWPVPVQVRW